MRQAHNASHRFLLTKAAGRKARCTELRDMTWSYSFGKSLRLAREIDLSHPERFYSWEKRHERCVDRTPHVTKYTHVNEMDEHVCASGDARHNRDSTAVDRMPFPFRAQCRYADIKTWIFLSSILCHLYAIGPQNCTNYYELMPPIQEFSFSNVDNWNVNMGTFPSQPPSEYNERTFDIVPSTVFDIQFDIYYLSSQLLALNYEKLSTYYKFQNFLYFFRIKWRISIGVNLTSFPTN